jgi:hypothetical protein
VCSLQRLTSVAPSRRSTFHQGGLLETKPPYRDFFRSEEGICGHDDFDVRDDDTALTIAALLADACSDRCTSFDLWQGTRQVRRIQWLRWALY